MQAESLAEKVDGFLLSFFFLSSSWNHKYRACMHWILSRQFCTKLPKVIDEAKILSQISISELFSIDFHWQVILTADTPVLNNPGGIIFTSTDAGATFKFIQLPFHMAQPIVYHFSNPDYLVALSIDVSLLNF